MSVTRLLTGREPSRHPKDHLYEEVYDPLVKCWFAALAESEERERLLDEIPRHDLVTNLQRLNDLFHRLVDESMSTMPGLDKAIDVVSEHRGDVSWDGYLEPTPLADQDAITASLAGKMKRNVSLGVIEALVCLESAIVFCHERLGQSGAALDATISRSRLLVASLAALHDEQEQIRFSFLTDSRSPVRYPDVDFEDVVSGRVRIGTDKFAVFGDGDASRLRFVGPPSRGASPTSPAWGCPAHRLRSPDSPALTLNDVLWNLLVDVYRRSGRFA